jgi:hypothetical protein
LWFGVILPTQYTSQRQLRIKLFSSAITNLAYSMSEDGEGGRKRQIPLELKQCQ